MAWQVGEKLKDGRYTIEQVLGHSGFGQTYVAVRNANNSERVVLKHLKKGNRPIAYKRMRVVGFGEVISPTVGIREGGCIPNRAARQDWVRKSKTERPCNFKE